MHAIAFDFIVNLNMPCWLSRSLALRTSSIKVSTPSNNCVLVKQKTILIEQKVVLIKQVVLGKMSHSLCTCNQYLGYIIPRASVRPWVGNLVSNS
jgi:hypothetical protein